MQDTFAFASSAIGRALGVSAIVTVAMFGPRTVDVVLGAGFERVQSGDVRVSSRRLEVQVTADDFDTESIDIEDWAGGTVEFLEGPLSGQILNVANAKPDVEGVSLTLTLKRPG